MRAGGNALVAACAALVVISAGTAYGATKAVNADAKVRVKEVFSLALDSSSIDFGTIRPGEWKPIETEPQIKNKVFCNSNTGKPWTLSIKATDNLVSDFSTIPIQNLKWMTVYAGSKNPPYEPAPVNFNEGIIYMAAYQDFALIDVAVFRSERVPLSKMPNYNTLPEGAEIEFQYAISVPDNMTPGTYRTTVLYTMTE